MRRGTVAAWWGRGGGVAAALAQAPPDRRLVPLGPVARARTGYPPQMAASVRRRWAPRMGDVMAPGAVVAGVRNVREGAAEEMC